MVVAQMGMSMAVIRSEVYVSGFHGRGGRHWGSAAAQDRVPHTGIGARAALRGQRTSIETPDNN